MSLNDTPVGADFIKKIQKDLPDSPGVYRMLDEFGDVLYVGKAKSLKKRVNSYSRSAHSSSRIGRMVALTHDMEFIQTHTEAEALLLEANLIKKLKPRYNILLRDDKSFPYIMLTGNHDFPLLKKHRGAQKTKGDYYGPFAGVSAVNKTINILQKVFMLRNCSDNIFASRNRPCLQYHIKRCTAPCVNYVSKEEYAQQVDDAKLFLAGKSKEVQESFAKKMQAASKQQDYEKAAQLRDRIQALSSIQTHQDINVQGIKDADVIALYREDSLSCVQVFFFRAGHNYGNKVFFPRHKAEDKDEDIIEAFIAQFYTTRIAPNKIIISHEIKIKNILEEALTLRKREHGDKGVLKISIPKRGAQKRIIDFALKNAKDGLTRERFKKASQERNLENVQALFDLETLPQRIEVYDNSHISGELMIGAMIVAGEYGFQKNAYRIFNIKQAEAGDDYGMMREVIKRRFVRSINEDEQSNKNAQWPDLVLIDGGKGQLSSVMDVLSELGLEKKIKIVAIAKGKDRNAGRETFFQPGRKEFQLPINDPTLHYLQTLRDEAHRFAIGRHRHKRSKQIQGSVLDDIPGVGPKRKKALLHYFGSGKKVESAAVKDLQQVEGISQPMAQMIYDYFQK